jgi:hypothetical protein
MIQTKAVALALTALATAIAMAVGAPALAQAPTAGHARKVINPQPLPPRAPPYAHRVQRTLEPGTASAINPQPLPPLPPPAKRRRPYQP